MFKTVIKTFFIIDVTEVLCELELTIHRVKVSTTPDGRVMDLFFVTDTRFVILDIASLLIMVQHFFLYFSLFTSLFSCALLST